MLSLIDLISAMMIKISRIRTKYSPIETKMITLELNKNEM